MTTQKRIRREGETVRRWFEIYDCAGEDSGNTLRKPNNCNRGIRYLIVTNRSDDP